MRKHHAFIIKWRDSSTLRGWQHIDGDHSVAEITSIGWVTKETKTAITLTTGISVHGSVCDAITIPREAITKRQKLKYHVTGD